MQTHLIYGAILGISLIGAFMTWTEEPDPISGDEIELLLGKKEDLQEIEWNSPNNFVRISKKGVGQRYKKNPVGNCKGRHKNCKKRCSPEVLEESCDQTYVEISGDGNGIFLVKSYAMPTISHPVEE